MTAHVTFKEAMLFVFVVFLTACGGGEGDDGNNKPTGPTLDVSYAHKTLEFTWSEQTGATHYKFYENVDGSSGFTQLGTDIQAPTQSYTLEIAVHLQQWASARYMVEACDSNGCVASNVITPNSDVLSTIAQLFASNIDPIDEFGTAVTMSGDGNYIAIGAAREDSAATGINGDQSDNSIVESGAVYVYVRNDNIWTQQAYLKASNTGSGDKFGSELSLNQDGSTLAVSAYLEDSIATGINGNQSDDSARDPGAVYIFTRSGTNWAQEAYIKASNTENPSPDYTEIADLFGSAIDLSDDGNILVVGSPYEDGAGNEGSDVHSCATPVANCAINAGAVYVFRRTTSTWSQTAYLKGTNSEAYDNFGTAVSLNGNGDTLVVGAPYENGSGTGVNSPNNNSGNLAGAAYVFTYTNNAWSQQAYLKASNTDNIDFFGISVAVSGDGNTVAIGATREASAATGINGDQTDDSTILAGAVYVFTRNANTWSQEAYIKASNTDDNHHFGGNTTLNDDGSVLVVGAIGDDSLADGINGDQNDNSKSAVGSVYVFVKNTGQWSQRSYVKSSASEGQDIFGRSIGINKPGTSMVIGAKTDTSSYPGDQGSAFVY